MDSTSSPLWFMSSWSWMLGRKRRQKKRVRGDGEAEAEAEEERERGGERWRGKIRGEKRGSVSWANFIQQLTVVWGLPGFASHWLPVWIALGQRWWEHQPATTHQAAQQCTLVPAKTVLSKHPWGKWVRYSQRFHVGNFVLKWSLWECQ